MQRVVLAATVVALGACTSPKVEISSFNGSSGRVATNGGKGSGGSTSSGTSSMSSGGVISSGGTTGAAAICNPACGANASCDDGVCRCIAGTSNCQARDGGLNCVDELSDNANCFNCGNACPPEATCRGGVCECDAGAACPTFDNGPVCYAFGSDPLNCGSCGNACAITQTCVDGGCACGGGETPCDAFCYDTSQDPSNCGTCGNLCGMSYAMDSICRDGACVCGGVGHLCAALPASSPPTCFCSGSLCPSPSFATDVYPLLAQQSGAFGCAASGCHGGARPAGGLGFLDEGGHMDAGMAYAELIGLDGGSGGGGGSGVFPACDAGAPAGVPSTQCVCVSRVVAGYLGESYLGDVLLNDLPANCGLDLPMPVDDDGGWVPLDACARQLVEQWIAAGAGQ